MTFEENIILWMKGRPEDIEQVLKIKDKHCLDKQRVREVVTAYLCNYSCRKSEKIKNMRDGILEELGL